MSIRKGSECKKFLRENFGYGFHLNLWSWKIGLGVEVTSIKLCFGPPFPIKRILRTYCLRR